jgi:hypothetical protein
MSDGDWGEKKGNGAVGFWAPATHRFCYVEKRSPPSIMDGRLTEFWADFGPRGWRENWPRPSLSFWFSLADWAGQLSVSSWTVSAFGPKLFKVFRFKDFCFSIF